MLSPKIDDTSVLGKPLGLFSKDPPTGFFRNGFCQTGPSDSGNHAVAATVTEDFLTFSASRGNNLRPVGLRGGSKWCLCSARWKEAMVAAQNGEISKDAVPKVHLHATNESAMREGGLKLEDLKKFAMPSETGNAGRDTPQSRKGGLGGAIKESSELAGKGEMTSRETGSREL